MAKQKAVDATELGPCIVAVGYVNNWGYVETRERGRKEHAHRVAWEEAHGPVPPGYEVHHKCHNRRCRRVSHLGILTSAENRSRQIRDWKLTEDEVRAIRDAAERQLDTQRGIAAAYGIHQALVSRIKNRQDYAWVS